MYADLIPLIPVSARVKARRRAEVLVRSLRGVDLLRFAEDALSDRSHLYYSPFTGRYVIVSPTRPIHASHILEFITTGEIRSVRILREPELRRILTGIVYHSLLEEKTRARGGVPEFQLPVVVDGVVVVSTFDALMPSPNGYYILELKSTDNPVTLSKGVLQVKLYITLSRMAGLHVEAGIVLGIRETRIVRTGFPLGKISSIVRRMKKLIVRRGLDPD